MKVQGGYKYQRLNESENETSAEFGEVDDRYNPLPALPNQKNETVHSILME